MHPAKSVILFTTASGAGYGLIALFALFDLAGRIPPFPIVTIVGIGLGLLLVVSGLVSSTFHLGHPERALRALTQWRTSWLSREGVMAAVSFAPILAYAYGRIAYPGFTEVWQPAVLALTVACAGLTVYCTAMIYASLKTIPAWSNPWTAICYLALSLSSGAVLLCAISYFYGFMSQTSIMVTVTLLIIAMGVKLLYWRNLGSASATSTAESATGLGNMGKVSLFEAPHDGDNYLLREMGFRIARKHAGRLRRVAILWGFVFPLVGITLASVTPGLSGFVLMGISVLMAFIGLLAERYLFFAEAKHVVTLYYGESGV